MKQRQAGPRVRFGIQLHILSLTMLFTLFAAGIIIVSSALSLSAEVRRSTIQSAEHTLQAAAAGVRQDIEEVDAFLLWCSIDSSVRTAMLNDVSTDFLTHTVYPIVSNRFNSMRTAAYIQRFLIFSESGRSIMMGTAASQSRLIDRDTVALLPGFGEGETLTRWERILQDPLMQSGIAMEGIPVTRRMARGPSQYAASIYLSVSPTLITDRLKQISFEDGSWLCWIMGDTLYRVEGGALVPLGPAEELLKPEPEQPDTLDANTRVYSAELEDTAGSVVVCPLGVHELYIGQVIPESRLVRPLYLLRGPALISLAVMLVMGAVLALLLHRVVAGPIVQLQKRIETVSCGDFSTDPSIEWPHELGDVGRGINRLSQSVSDLMAKRVEDEKQRLALEYRMLQNQISPHFIYNTLNSIKWMATIQHAPGVAEMVTALSRLLKSVSKGNQRLVPLAEEVSLLEDYFTIQRYRYGGTITLTLPEAGEIAGFGDYRIPRFSLQPLAENAIFHGIEPAGGMGRLSLSLVPEENGDLTIRLADDGVGMQPEQIARVLAGPNKEEDEKSKFQHVGVWNVHRLLQLSFGPGYGLSIESPPGGGTVVSMRLPRPEGQTGVSGGPADEKGSPDGKGPAPDNPASQTEKGGTEEC